MTSSKHDRPAALQLSQAVESDLPRVAPPPLTHQPVVAVSLVLIATTLAQLAIYFVNARLLAPEVTDAGLAPPSTLVANDWAYQAVATRVQSAAPLGIAGQRLLFAGLLILNILSAAAWYAVARHLLGPAWALWSGVLWGLHPLFGFLAQRPSALTLAVLCAPLAWGCLLWWNRCRRRRVAFLAGTLAGLTTLVSLPTGIAFIPAVLLLLVTDRNRRRWVQNFGLLCLGFALPIATVWLGVTRAAVPNPAGSFSRDLIRGLDNSSSPLDAAIHARMAEDGTAVPAGTPQMFAEGVMAAPLASLKWLGSRAGQTLYATSRGQFQRPLFATQMAVFLPAIWGVVICLRQPAWRWPAAACLLLVVAHWIVAAVAEPLARSLAPVGGMLVIFALVGLADLYERAFGRRLHADG